jgi:hypothetical protein
MMALNVFRPTSGDCLGELGIEFSQLGRHGFGGLGEGRGVRIDRRGQGGHA